MTPELIAKIEHDLRAPLTAVLGMSEAMLDGIYGPLGERQVKPLSLIEQGGLRLKAVIRNVADWLRIGSGCLELSLQPCRIEEASREALATALSWAGKPDGEAAYVLHSQRETVLADPHYLRAMLASLLRTAFRLCPPLGKVGLAVDDDPQAALVRFTVWYGDPAAPPATSVSESSPRLEGGSTMDDFIESNQFDLVLTEELAELHAGRLDYSGLGDEAGAITLSLPWAEPST